MRVEVGGGEWHLKRSWTSKAAYVDGWQLSFSGQLGAHLLHSLPLPNSYPTLLLNCSLHSLSLIHILPPLLSLPPSLPPSASAGSTP